MLPESVFPLIFSACSPISPLYWNIFFFIIYFITPLIYDKECLSMKTGPNICLNRPDRSNVCMKLEGSHLDLRNHLNSFQSERDGSSVTVLTITINFIFAIHSPDY